MYLFCSRYCRKEFDAFLNSYKVALHSPIQKKMIKFNDLNIKKPYENKTLLNELFIIAETLEITNLDV